MPATGQRCRTATPCNTACAQNPTRLMRTQRHKKMVPAAPMKKSEQEKLCTAFGDAPIPRPHRTCAHPRFLPPAPVSAVQRILLIESLRPARPLRTPAAAPAATAPSPAHTRRDTRAPSRTATYQDILKHIPRAYRLVLANHAAVLAQQRKTATICARELRRGLSRTSRTNPALKNKRINKELHRYINRGEREEREKVRREDAEREARRRTEEAAQEELRQQRKFNYLMSQTEAFSKFFLNRQSSAQQESAAPSIGADAPPGLSEDLAQSAAERQLAHLREFDAAPAPRYEHRQVAQPRLMKATLRPYQLKGLNWLVNLYSQGINGILADDMGLGKTIQAIALLAFLAETEGLWGPFLVVTPASTLHNWEDELARFVPAFRVVVYYGALAERAELRRAFKDSHVVVTSYQVAVSDTTHLKKVRWQYMILDEAQAIKSNTSLRWRALLSIRARNRCLLTGTPIQNNMQELWSLLHFIMPTLFDSLSEFSDWFLTENQVNESQIDKLHTILKPFMLRRHKEDIREEIGTKEMVHVYCNMSVRQRELYESLRTSIALGGEAGALPGAEAPEGYENTLMQLKKVCNHPSLFVRPETTTAFSLVPDGERSCVEPRGALQRLLPPALEKAAAAAEWLLRPECMNAAARICERRRIYAVALCRDESVNLRGVYALSQGSSNGEGSEESVEDGGAVHSLRCATDRNGREFHLHMLRHCAARLRSEQRHLLFYVARAKKQRVESLSASAARLFPQMCAAPPRPAARHAPPRHTPPSCHVPPLNTLITDSGKLRALDTLLEDLKKAGHRALIYFQMTRMMDLFEEYLIKRAHSYIRLDGSVRVATRKELVRRWQAGEVFLFILSTRAGGVGINLTAADTVIFYDSDWNPTVDQQAMDRAHRLGQTKKVTVYRLITRDSIEEKIIERATKKDKMQQIVIQGDVFNH